MLVLFSHGKESGAWGRKIQQLSQVSSKVGFDLDSIDYTDLDQPDERVQRLLLYLSQVDGPVTLVGSSMGGYVSLVAASLHQVQGLFLLAPALYMDGYEQQSYQPIPCPLEVVHGWHDDVVPVENSLRFAKTYPCTLHLVDDDHRLRKSLPSIESWFESFLAPYHETR